MSHKTRRKIGKSEVQNILQENLLFEKLRIIVEMNSVVDFITVKGELRVLTFYLNPSWHNIPFQHAFSKYLTWLNPGNQSAYKRQRSAENAYVNGMSKLTSIARLNCEFRDIYSCMAIYNKKHALPILLCHGFRSTIEMTTFESILTTS